jgi:5-methyltetrahydropteroyltriglutamate--homocysteine methyltransferase
MPNGPRKLNPPFRADVVGSLLRPERLKQARIKAGKTLGNPLKDKQKPEITLDGLKQIEDDCIREAVKFQEDVGMQVITDGEFRRGSWAYDLVASIVGVELRAQEGPFQAAFQGTAQKSPIAHTDGKLGRRPGGLAVDDYKFTSSLTSRAVKVTVPSPTMLYVRGGRAAINEDVYPDIEEFFEDAGRLYRDEIAELAAAGCAYVQIDNVDTALLCDPKFQDIARNLGIDPMDMLDIQGRMVSAATRGRPDDIAVSMHLCRGNSQGHWMARGGYEYVAEGLFNKFDVDAYFLEYDSERAGDFAPLRFVRPESVVVLGLVTTKTPENDDRDTLLRRIEAASAYMPLENLALSPQCGFASDGTGNPITLDDQRRKLELILDVSQEVWGGA